MDHQHQTARARYLRRRWSELSILAAGRDIVVFGAGRHTRWILESLKLHEDGPTIRAILDDDPRGAISIAGIRVERPESLEPENVGVIVVSSDSIEDRLVARSAAWAAHAPERQRPVVFRLYQRLPSGPYDGSHERMFEQLARRTPGDDGAENFGEFTAVHSLPRALPRAAGERLPIPPVGVRSGYDASDEEYLRSGRQVASTILESVRRSAGPGAQLRDLLEWGCSSGRVLRHVHDLSPGARCWGCDIDAWTIDWAAGHLSPPMNFFRSTEVPALPLESASFDLVYAVSVFTHLSDHVDAWLMELRRILRPGGHLFASINDEHVWAMCAENSDHYIARLCPRLDFSRPLEDDFVTQGRGRHAQSFWHTRGVRSRWSFAMELVEILPRAIDGVQTGIVMRKRGAGVV